MSKGRYWPVKTLKIFKINCDCVFENKTENFKDIYNSMTTKSIGEDAIHINKWISEKYGYDKCDCTIYKMVKVKDQSAYK